MAEKFYNSGPWHCVLFIPNIKIVLSGEKYLTMHKNGATTFGTTTLSLMTVSISVKRKSA
jgi:hypothetical protein